MNPRSELRKLRLGLPKGSLQATTEKLFKLAGFDLRVSGRSYYPDIDDPELECILIRPQEMARYVGQGVIDCGITGLDWVLENGVDVEELADLRAPWPNYGPVRWILAVKEDSEFQTPKDLAGKRIATEIMGLTERYFSQLGVEARLRGAIEAPVRVLERVGGQHLLHLRCEAGRQPNEEGRVRRHVERRRTRREPPQLDAQVPVVGGVVDRPVPAPDGALLQP